MFFRKKYWVFRKTFAVLFVGILVIAAWSYSQFKELASSKQKDILLEKTFLSKKILTEYLKEKKETNFSVISNKIAAEVGERIQIIQNNGFVLSDSVFGSYTLKEFSHIPEYKMARENGFSFINKSKIPNSGAPLIMTLPVNIDGKFEGFIRLSASSLLYNTNSIFMKTLLLILFIAFLLSLFSAKMINQKILSSLQGVSLELKGFHFEEKIARNDDVWNAFSGELRTFDKNLNRKLKNYETTSHEWEALFGTLQQGIIVIDRKSRIISCNIASKQILNLRDQTKLEGQSFIQVYRNSELNRLIDNTLNSDLHFVEEEIQIRNSLNAVNSYTVSALKFEYQKSKEGVLVVFTDITKIKKLENMRKEFVSNVSHELKTPLAAISASAESLEDLDPTKEKINPKLLKIISKNSMRMSEILNDLMVISRLEQQDPNFINSFDNKDFKDTLNSAVSSCESKAVKQNVNLQINAESAKFFANHNLLKQVLRNLIENAVRYSPDNNNVIVSAKIENDNLIFSVKDSGIGISEKEISRIFERFYRVDSSRNRETGGTGLGLSIVKHIINLHNGTIDIKSLEGQGTEFKITIPNLS